MQAISADPAFVRLEKGVYALACLAPDAEPTARAPRAVKVLHFINLQNTAHVVDCSAAVCCPASHQSHHTLSVYRSVRAAHRTTTSSQMGTAEGMPCCRTGAKS